MTQNNLYMEDDDLKLYVDVEPVAFYTIEDCLNAAEASAESARQSALSAQTWSDNIVTYKTNLELFYAQVMNNLSDWYNNAVASLNNLFYQMVNTIQTYVNQAKGYAEQAQNTVDNRVSLEHLNQSKALETGSLSDDNDVLLWINQIAHSTFVGYQVEGSTPGYLPDGVTPLDPKKFTKVGTPIITDDGFASNGDYQNYITTNTTLDLTNKTCVVKGSFTINALQPPAYTQPLSGSALLFYQYVSNQYKSILQLKIGGVWSDGLTVTSSIVGIPIYYELIIDNNNSSASCSFIQNGVNIGTLLCENITPLTTDTTFEFYRSGGASGRGYVTIDLKQFSITVDGVEVFSGNKTGIDTIKPLNFVSQGCLYAYEYNDSIIYTNGSYNSTILYNADGSFYTGSDWTITDGNVYYNGNQATYTPSSDIPLHTQNDFVDWNESKISSDGILSGSRYPVYAFRPWAATDNINFPNFDITTLQGKSWTISVPFNFNGNKQNKQQLLTLCENNHNFGYPDTEMHMYVDYYHIYLTIPTGEGSSKANNHNCTYIPSDSLTNYLDKDLIISLSFDIQTGTYTMKLTDSNGVVQNSNWIRPYTPTTENKELQIINGTVTGGYLRAAAFYGMSIDLNGIKVVADGNLVYQPCLKIPYTESKTGSKIVNSIYRDRVNDMYEQFGYAPYYTLDEQNCNFTLPKGEIYGMIENIKKLVIQLTS